jgi:hypothetical protein
MLGGTSRINWSNIWHCFQAANSRVVLVPGKNQHAPADQIVFSFSSSYPYC